MPSWLSSFVEIFRSEKCQKMVNYDGKTLTIKALQANVPNFPLQVGEIISKYEKIRDASEIAMALDDYQFQMCKICKGLGKNDAEWRKYNELRVSSFQMITNFRLTLIALSEGAQVKKQEADTLVDKMMQVLEIDKEAIPQTSLERVRLKDDVPRDEILTLDTQAISRAKIAADVNEKDLEQFLEVIEKQQLAASTKGLQSTLENVHSLIYDIKEQHYKSNIEGLSYEEVYEKIRPKISQLYMIREYRELIGQRRGEDISRLLANQRANLDEFSDASNIGITSREDESRRKIIFTFDRIFAKLNEIDFCLS
jgi:hypothetical protein